MPVKSKLTQDFDKTPLQEMLLQERSRKSVFLSSDVEIRAGHFCPFSDNLLFELTELLLRQRARILSFDERSTFWMSVNLALELRHATHSLFDHEVLLPLRHGTPPSLVASNVTIASLEHLLEISHDGALHADHFLADSISRRLLRGQNGDGDQRRRLSCRFNH